MHGWNRASIATLLLIVAIALGARIAVAVDDNPASTAQLELTANQAFNRGQYNTALPILKKLSATFGNEPGRVGPIKEKIRVCEMAIASLKNAGPPTTLPAPEALSAESRKRHKAPKAGEVSEMTIKELGNFEYDQDRGGMIPADVKQYDNATVRLRGFMIPMDQAENITQFALVPSLFNCCVYGQGPQIQHTIVVSCPKGKSVGYCPDEITVEGTLKVGEKKDEGYIVSIFELDVKSVKPAPK